MSIRRPTPAKQGEINFPFFDRFTIVHFLIGVLYAYLGFSFFVTIMLALFWEVIENLLKAYIPKIFPHASADSWKNSFGDTLAVCVGWSVIS